MIILPSLLRSYPCRRVFLHWISTLPTDDASIGLFTRLPKKEFKKLSLEERHVRSLAKLKGKQKRKRQRKTEALAALSQEEKEVVRKEKNLQKSLLQKRLQWAVNFGYRVCVDLSLEGVHSQHDRSSQCTQLLGGYSFMRRRPCPLRLHLTGVGPLDAPLARELERRGLCNWPAVPVHAQPAWEVFGPGSAEGAQEREREQAQAEVVILSPDASEVLREIEPDKVRT